MKPVFKMEIEFTADEKMGSLSGCQVYKVAVSDYPKYMQRRKDSIEKIHAMSVQISDKYTSILGKTVKDAMKKYDFDAMDLTNERFNIEKYCGCSRHIGSEKYEDLSVLDKIIEPLQYMVFSPKSAGGSIRFVSDMIKDDQYYGAKSFDEIREDNSKHIAPNIREVIEQTNKEEEDDNLEWESEIENTGKKV